jgi:hypothetical protein
MARTKFIPQRDYHPDPRGVDLCQQTEIYEQWSAVMVAIHCDYKEGSLMDLKKDIGHVAVSLSKFSSENADPRILGSQCYKRYKTLPFFPYFSLFFLSLYTRFRI